MKIALDVTPLAGASFGGHKVRGVGKYIELLQANLPRIDTKNEYIFVTRGVSLPSDIDLIHYPYFELFFFSIPFIKSHKTLVTVHDLTPIKFPKQFKVGIKGSAKWQIQKRLLKKTDGIITDSKSAQSDIVALTGTSITHTHVVYLAVDKTYKTVKDKKSLEQIRKKYNLPDEFVLYVGDVTWNKNLPNLVQAIKKLNVTLVMVGKSLASRDYDQTNPWNKDKKKVHELTHNDERFIFTGFVSNEDLNALYNLADVFAMPSLYEGFGLPILESMRAGCPVVTSKSGSIPEVGGDSVYYVDPNNIDAISDGIGEVFFNRDLKKEFSQKGLIQGEKFTIEKMIRDLVRVYESL